MSKWVKEIIVRYDDKQSFIYGNTLGEVVGELVRCKECKHSEYREEFEDYECHSSGCGLVYDAYFYCADGERRTDE